MPSHKALLIVNPNAGNHSASDLWPTISSTLIRGGYEFDFEFTTRRYHAIEMTIDAIGRGVREIVAVGGDGTLHEVVNGIFLQKNVPPEAITLGIIPIGSGNDTIRCLDVSNNLESAINTILEHRVEPIDAGSVSFMDFGVTRKRYFINVAGTGLEGEVVYKYERSLDKEKGNSNRYFAVLLSLVLFYRSKKWIVKVDGKELFKGHLMSLSVGNGRFLGGGMEILPYAIVDDGLFDITLVHKISIFKIIGHMNDLLHGRIYDVNKVAIHARGTTVDIEPLSGVGGHLETDGEAMGTPPFHFEIFPGSLYTIVGKRFGSTPKE